MDPLLKTYLCTPLMSKVQKLDDYIEKVSILPPKRMQRNIVEPLMNQVGILHTQALRELRGLDYYKRMNDLIFEIQATAYRIFHKRGWTLRVTSIIDSMCDEIAEELRNRRFAINAKSMKSKDENSSANLK